MALCQPVTLATSSIVAPSGNCGKSTFLAKFTIVPIPIWLELEKDRPVRPHSAIPLPHSDRLLRDRDRRSTGMTLFTLRAATTARAGLPPPPKIEGSFLLLIHEGGLRRRGTY